MVEKTKYVIAFFAIFAPLLWTCSCTGRSTPTVADTRSSEVVSNEPLAPYQEKLLEQAFRTATLIPAKPHIKDRSRAQARVVEACLELDLPKKAAGYTEEIDNWRRGLCYAELGFYCAQNKDVDKARRYLQLAEETVQRTEGWRRDRIRVKIAQAYTWLGEADLAQRFQTGVVDSESGKTATVKAMLCDEDSFDELMATIDGYVATGNFDIIKNSLESYAKLYDRFYTSEERRSRVEGKIKTSWRAVPIFVRIELLTELCETALDHFDRSKALALVNEAQAFLDNYEWPLRHHIAIAAKLAALRFRAGEKQKARADADAAFALFDEEGDRIVNIWRAGALRPLAETYQIMGETETALSVYKLAIEEGIENPNSRPRAEDLSATCSSMALYAVEPNSALWERIHQIHEGLSEPW